jgi:hypothetical protein
MLSASICLLNSILIFILLPSDRTQSTTLHKYTLIEAERVQLNSPNATMDSPYNIVPRNDDITSRPKSVEVAGSRKSEGDFWMRANPVGAIVMLSRSRSLRVSSAAYFLVCVAQTGVQSCWVNYLQFRLGWSASAAGSSLTVVGLVVALLPPLVM